MRHCYIEDHHEALRCATTSLSPSSSRKSPQCLAHLSATSASSTITRKLTTLRIQSAREEANATGRPLRSIASRSASLHPALEYEERSAKPKEKKIAGPAAPTSWATPVVAPGGIKGEAGRAERRRLRPLPFGEEERGEDEMRLTRACLRVIARGMDEETREVVGLLPVHLKEALLDVAAIEAPLSSSSLLALLVDDDTETNEAGEAEWDIEEEEQEPLERLDLRFNTLTTSTLQTLLVTRPSSPRFPQLTHLDLSFTARLTLTDLLPSLHLLTSLSTLSLLSHESSLSTTNELQRLARSTPFLTTFEINALPLDHWRQISWSTSWRYLSLLVLHHLVPPTSGRRRKELAQNEVRAAAKEGGRREKWLEVRIA